MKKNSSRPRGRPRLFDREYVLDRAVTTFWAKGYHGASMEHLTESMGINRPSLYGSFGSKHDLFLEAIDRYAVTFGCQPVEALQREADIKKAVAAFLGASIRCTTSPDGPKGCLIVSVANERAEEDRLVQNKISGMLSETERVVADRFRVAKENGQLTRKSDPEALAQITISITHSFAARARAGTNHEELSGLAEMFMEVLFPATI